MKINTLPKIGIRPVIDGRRMGVRESLEEQTMNMAKATATLLTEKLRHACGAAVECVISDTCIAGMAEAAACEEKFSSQNVGLTITSVAWKNQLATTPSLQASRGNFTGPINIPMAIPLKRSSTVHLTGMACANPLSWRPKTTVLTAWQC